MPDTHPANIDIDAALAEARSCTRARNPKSRAQYEEACAALPGGNTRSAIYAEPFPLTMVKRRGRASVGCRRPRIRRFPQRIHRRAFGHSHPAIRKAIDAALDGGINFGAHGMAEAQVRRGDLRPVSRRSSWCASPIPAPRPI